MSTTSRTIRTGAAALLLATGMLACTDLPEQMPGAGGQGGAVTGGMTGIQGGNSGGGLFPGLGARGGMVGGMGGTAVAGAGGDTAGGAGGTPVAGAGGTPAGGAPAGGAGGQATGGAGGACTNGQRRCLNGTQAQLCDNGVWANAAPIVRNLAMNAGFDLAAATPWVVTGPQPAGVIGAHGSGRYTSAPNSAWLGGLNSSTETLTQQVTFPANTIGVQVYFRGLILTEETLAGQWDKLTLTVGEENIGVISNEQAEEPPQFVRWMSSPVMGRVAGMTLPVRFTVTTDATEITSFFVDDVEVNASLCE